MKQILKDQRKVVILIIVIAVAVIVGTLIYINFIWNKDKVVIVDGSNITTDDTTNTSANEYKVNTNDINKYNVNSEQDSKTAISNGYFDDMNRLLRTDNYDELFAKVDQGYLTSQGFNKDSLYNYLVSKHLIGTSDDNIEMLSMESGKQENDTTIYRIKYKMKFYIGYVNLIETFPYEYTISFLQDTIPTAIEHSYIRTVNGLKFEITEKTRRDSSITYRVQITNNNDDKVTFNFNTIANVGLLVGNDGEIKQTSTALSASTNELTKDSYLVRNMYFPINMQYQNDISGMVFYNVKIGNEKQDLVVRF